MNKPEKRTGIRILITIILLVSTFLMFYQYAQENNKRIAEINASYIRNSTVQTSEWIVDILDGAKGSINNMAQLYGNTLTSEEIDYKDLGTMRDKSVFDYVHFIDKDGMDIYSTGIATDVSDRSYFIKGMQGESGMDGTYTSRMTNERVVVFYAPVRYNGKIIGVLAGHYMEKRMRRILENSLFDQQISSFLCLEDGTVVCSVGIEEECENVLDFLRDNVTAEERENMREVFAKEKQSAFTYRGPEGNMPGYIASLPGNTWTILQIFPSGAYKKMQKDANAAGMALEIKLVLLCSFYIAFLLLQEWYRRKRLEQDKLEAEGIIRGINRLFKRFILVRLRENTYVYLNGQTPSVKGLSAKGNYSDFLTFFQDRQVSGTEDLYMTQVLSPKYIRKHSNRKIPYERYEYRIKNDHEDKWENIAVIPLDWKKGKPISVLLAVQEVTGLKQRELQTQNALREAYQSAKAANNAKSEFLSRMSHDIRTPMNAIVGMTAIAGMHLDDSARVKDCLNKITISSQHLLGLINEVLDMSKIESGKLELTEEEFDLSETVDRLLGIFNSQIDAKGLTLSVTLQDITHKHVLGDSQRLSQVLVNIMGNAIKFTPNGGSISLQVSERPSRVEGMACYEFIITDTGIGMDEEFIDKVFEPFARSSDSSTSKIEGTGLGMAIAKSIVNMMNGDIKIKSKKGQGTQMTVTAYLQYISKTEDTDSSREKDDEAGTEMIQPREQFAGKRVLLVDDNELNLEIGEEILAMAGFEVDTAEDGAKSVECLKNSEPGTYQLVLMDIQMPVMNGYQAVKAIRESGRKDLEEMPVIAMTADAFSSDIRKAQEAGMNGHIAKPIDINKLMEILKDWVK